MLPSMAAGEPRPIQTVVPRAGDGDGYLRERVKDLELLLELNAAVNRGDDVLQILKLFSEHAGRVFGSHSTAIYRLTGDGRYLELQPLTWAHTLPGLVGRMVRGLLPSARIRIEEGGRYAGILSGKKPVTTGERADRVRMAFEFEGADAIAWAVEQVIDLVGAFVISVPIMVGEEPLGLLDISREVPFTQRDAEHLEGLAGQLAILFQHRSALDALAVSERRIRSLAHSMRDTVYIVDARSVVVEAWGAWPDGLPLCGEPVGHALSEVIGEGPMRAHKQAMREAMRGGERRCEWSLGPEEPDQRRFETILSPGLADEEAVVCVARDITYRSQLERALQEAALYDDLTGLLNRRGFMVLAEKELVSSKLRGAPASVIYADLDDLKGINDAFGHEAGDCALREVATLFSDTFRESDILGRLGGDEFAVVTLDTPESQVTGLVERLNERLGGRAIGEEHPYPLSLSIGVASDDPGDRQTIEELLRAADSRMYAQKRAKRRT
jgi:diguanylate cyclase (GGDEF)-like protein